MMAITKLACADTDSGASCLGEKWPYLVVQHLGTKLDLIMHSSCRTIPNTSAAGQLGPVSTPLEIRLSLAITR